MPNERERKVKRKVTSPKPIQALGVCVHVQERWLIIPSSTQQHHVCVVSHSVDGDFNTVDESRSS